MPAVAAQDSLDALSKAIIIDGLQKATHPREHPLPLSTLIAALLCAFSMVVPVGLRPACTAVPSGGGGRWCTPGTLWAAVCQVGVHGRAERQDFVRDIFLGTKGADLLVRRTNKRAIASHRIAPPHRRRGMGSPACLPTHTHAVAPRPPAIGQAHGTCTYRGRLGTGWVALIHDPRAALRWSLGSLGADAAISVSIGACRS